MQETNHTILFIDDNSKGYMSTLEVVAKAHDIALYATDNVLDGLEFLNIYPETADAVILDLSFPKGEIQGMEALQKIKEKQPHLPVIMLTDSDTAADLYQVVECMRKGAYDYVGKRTLNPVKLFQIVEESIQKSKRQFRLEIKEDIRDQKQHFYTVTKPINYGVFKEQAVFGFELVSVNKPGNEQEADNLQRSAILWHENLLKSLQVAYRDYVQLNLKYITEGRSIKCLLIFTLMDTNEIQLQKSLNNLQHDLRVFFNSTKIDNAHPYIFAEISDEKFLLSANDYSERYIYNLFYRRPVKIKDTVSIGFASVAMLTDDETIAYQPDLLFPFPSKPHFDNELFKALLNQNEYAEIDVQLLPQKLLNEELDIIRQVIKKPSVLDTPNLSYEEQKQFAEYLQKFITTVHDKFMVSVVLKRSSKNWEQHLKTGILNYFFGSQMETGYELRKADNLMRFKVSTESGTNQLPFFYSIQEVMQVFRLPIPGFNDLPGFQQQSHSFHYLPDNLQQEGILLGEKKTGNRQTEIRIAKEALARHLYIMGQTGTGKSTLLKTMIADCLQKNNGFTVIDPHGDLFDEVLKMIPKNKQKKLSIINTTDSENSYALNPLHYNENLPQAKSLVINELVRAFHSLYDMKIAGGPMFEVYFKNALLLLMDDNVQRKFGKSDLSDIAAIFFKDEYRKKLLEECSTESVKDFFRGALATHGDQAFVNFGPYVVSKLTRFVEDYYLAPILSGKKKNIDFRRLMDEENILLVKMDKGLIGADNTQLLGQILLSNLFMAGMSRTDIKMEDRKPHYIFIDEFQNFIKSDAGSALSEVRKYGLNLILANQTLGQLSDELVQSLLGNVGSLVFFRPGINDYEKIRHYVEPDFKREDVLKLPNFNCIARLMINNIPSDPFIFQTKNI